MRIDDLHSLPDKLPIPVDDGACDHLRGRHVFYPVFPLDADAGHVADWLRERTNGHATPQG